MYNKQDEEDLPLFLVRAPGKVVQTDNLPRSTGDQRSPEVAVGPPGWLLEQSGEEVTGVFEKYDIVRRRYVKTVTFRRWDEESKTFKIFSRDFTILNEPILEDKKEPRIVTPWSEGFLSFESKDFLELSADELYKLCPYEKSTLDNIDWWQGWYNSAKFYWNFEHKESS